MGRIKKEHDGWKSSGLWLRFQYPKINDDENQITHKRKNTRKWCKGRVGVPHEKELVKKTNFLDWHWTEYRCKNCGKKIFN